MTMIKINLKKNKVYPNREARRGFVLLFAVTISSIILAITLGVTDIALKEINFSTSAQNTNDAFFAADTGIECALVNDKSTSNSFQSGGSGQVQCLGGNINLTGSFPSWSFIVSGLGNMGVSCAKVNVVKDTTSNAPLTKTTITSEGYNIGDSSCNSSSQNRIERKLQVVYGAQTNVALATNGATASASSTGPGTFQPSYTINGERSGSPWGGVGGGWRDNTANFPPDDWLQVDFNASYTLNEINVFGVQDNYTAPSAPTLAMTSTLYGLKDFDIQYWNSSSWQNVSGGVITNNNRVWVQLTGINVTTSKIRLLIHDSQPHDWSRVTEIEAWK